MSHQMLCRSTLAHNLKDWKACSDIACIVACDDLPDCRPHHWMIESDLWWHQLICVKVRHKTYKNPPTTCNTLVLSNHLLCVIPHYSTHVTRIEIEAHGLDIVPAYFPYLTYPDMVPHVLIINYSLSFPHSNLQSPRPMTMEASWQPRDSRGHENSTDHLPTL